MSKWEPVTYANETKETLLVDRHGKPLLVREPRSVGFRPPAAAVQPPVTTITPAPPPQP